MVKITGWYQLPGQLPQQVSFDELFDKAFMKEYTKFRSFEQFLNGGHFTIRSQADFEALPEEKMDAHVARTTKFNNWEDMLDTATDLYAVKKLGKNNVKRK